MDQTRIKKPIGHHVIAPNRLTVNHVAHRILHLVILELKGRITVFAQLQDP